jgi:hypothetical protein
MGSIERQYTDELHKQLGYWGVWTPDVEIEIGTVGTMKDRVFVPKGHLREYGIDFGITPDHDKASLDYQSKAGVDVQIQLEGEAKNLPNIPPLVAGLSIAFSREAAVVLAFKGARQPRMADQDRVARHIAAKAQSHEFPQEYVIVTQVYECDSMSVVVSQSRDSEFAVTADVDFKAGLVDLASASTEFTVRTSRSLAAKVLAATGGTPMFRGIRLKAGWFNDVHAHELEDAVVENQSLDLFEELTPDTIDREPAVA